MELICRNIDCETFRRSVKIIAPFLLKNDNTLRSTNAAHNFS